MRPTARNIADQADAGECQRRKSAERGRAGEPGSQLVGELACEITRRTELGVRILVQMVGELREDPTSPASWDPGRGQLVVQGVQVGHASTASIVFEKRRQRSRLAPSSFSPRLVML